MEAGYASFGEVGCEGMVPQSECAPDYPGYTLEAACASITGTYCPISCGCCTTPPSPPPPAPISPLVGHWCYTSVPCTAEDAQACPAGYGIYSLEECELAAIAATNLQFAHSPTQPLTGATYTDGGPRGFNGAHSWGLGCITNTQNQVSEQVFRAMWWNTFQPNYNILDSRCLEVCRAYCPPAAPPPQPPPVPPSPPGRRRRRAAVRDNPMSRNLSADLSAARADATSFSTTWRRRTARARVGAVRRRRRRVDGPRLQTLGGAAAQSLA